MIKLSKTLQVSFYLFFLNIFIAEKAFAVCPVCTIAVAGGVGLSRWLGIDDTVIGLWIGGLTMSLIIWTLNWFDKKNIKFIGRKIITTISYYGLMVVPLFYTGIMGHPLNKMWGMDKLLIGIILGTIGFLGGVKTYDYLKKKNNNRAYFPFQKVAMPILPLVILSIIFYFITVR